MWGTLQLDFQHLITPGLMIPKINFKAILQNSDKWQQIINHRASPCNLPNLLSAYTEYKRLDQQRMLMERDRNALARERGDAHDGRQLRSGLDAINTELSKYADYVNKYSEGLPNEISSETPLDGDQVIAEFNESHGTCTAYDHVQFMKENGWMDAEDGVRVAGAGFVALRGTAAILEHALINYALKFAIDRGFQLCTVPDLVSSDVLFGAGFAPRQSSTNDAVFRVAGGELVLAGTAELSIVSMYRNQRIQSPIKLVTVGHAFRREVGNHGVCSRGLYRVHQFTKAEMFVLSPPATSTMHFTDLLSTQSDLIKSLGFQGRILEMSAKELGASAYRKRDIELWYPHSRRFGEVTSASLCTDYQARRMNITCGSGMYAHTMNATAMAVPRIIQCIAEHGGSIPVPLKPFMQLF